MAHTTKHDVRIKDVMRIESTALGNPRFRVFTDDGAWNTAGNHSFAFLIEPNQVRNRRATLTIDSRLRITDMEVH